MIVLAVLGNARALEGATAGKLLLVAVACQDGQATTVILTAGEDGMDDECGRTLLAYLPRPSASATFDEMALDSASSGEPATLSVTVKPGWPRTFPNYRPRTVATADFEDPLGRITILNETDGTVHALAPDATTVQGWPVSLGRDANSVMPTTVDLDEDGQDELLLGIGPLYAYSRQGALLSGWPFFAPGTPFEGFNARTPIGVRLQSGDPLRIVIGSGIRVFVLDLEAAPLPGWPVQIPKGVFASPNLANVAVGDLSGDGSVELALTIGNESQAHALNQQGEPLNGFPVYAGGNPSPLLGGADADEPSLADLDGDGALEMLFWASPAPGGKAGVVALRGDSSMQPGWPRLSQSGRGNFGVAAGDVDGDGDLEVLASTVNGGEPGAGGVYLWHGDGTPVSGWPKFFPNVSFPNPVVIADVDGDGIGDPVVGGFSVVSPTNGFVYAWKGNGETISGFPISIPFRPVGLGAPTIDDLEGDGIADLNITTQPGLLVTSPGRVHWFDLGVPYRAEGMEWPTRGHDMARTAAYRPPVRRVPMEVQLAPPLLNTRTAAPPLTVLLRMPAEETARPRSLRLRFVNGVRIPELEGLFLEDDGEAVAFRLDGEAVRALLTEPGEHTLGFWTEAVGGLDGVLYEGEAVLTLRPLPVRPLPLSPRDPRLRAPRVDTPVPVEPAPVGSRASTG